MKIYICRKIDMYICIKYMYLHFHSFTKKFSTDDFALDLNLEIKKPNFGGKSLSYIMKFFLKIGQ